MATAQIPDLIVVEGEKHRLHTEPLAPYLKANPQATTSMRSPLPSFCTASWRGYQATWEVLEGKLFLIGLNSDPCNSKPNEIPIKTLFPNDPDRRFADWFSGMISIPHGKLVKLIPGGYASKFESYLELTIQDGVVIKDDRHDMAEEERREEERWQKLLSENKEVAEMWKGFSEGLNKHGSSALENESIQQARKNKKVPNIADYGTDLASLRKYGSDISEVPVDVCREAAKKNNPDGVYCTYQHETGKDEMTILREAARLGHPLAQNNLAMKLADDRKQNSAEIVRLIKASAAKGIPQAQVTMGWWYMKGLHGIAINYAEAMNWNRKAYKQGHSEGANNIGELYEKGLGVTKNIDQAKSWYRKASVLGNSEATERLDRLNK